MIIIMVIMTMKLKLITKIIETITMTKIIMIVVAILIKKKKRTIIKEKQKIRKVRMGSWSLKYFSKSIKTSGRKK